MCVLELTLEEDRSVFCAEGDLNRNQLLSRALITGCPEQRGLRDLDNIEHDAYLVPVL